MPEILIDGKFDCAGSDWGDVGCGAKCRSGDGSFAELGKAALDEHWLLGVRVHGWVHEVLGVEIAAKCWWNGCCGKDCERSCAELFASLQIREHLVYGGKGDAGLALANRVHWDGLNWNAILPDKGAWDELEVGRVDLSVVLGLFGDVRLVLVLLLVGRADAVVGCGSLLDFER